MFRKVVKSIYMLGHIYVMIAKVVKNLIFRIKSRNILGGIGPGPFSNPNSRGKHKISSKKVKVEVLKTGPN